MVMPMYNLIEYIEKKHLVAYGNIVDDDAAEDDDDAIVDFNGANAIDSFNF